MMALEVAGLTDIGSVRQHNEDCIFFDEGLGLFVVADGLGGHAAGEVASKIVVDEVSRYIEQTASATEPASTDFFDANLSIEGNRLKMAIILSDKAITADIAANPERETMGSTVVACLMNGNRATLAHVGDSRAYKLTNNEIKQITRDHSWVAEQVANGFLTIEEARVHPFRNVITQALGNSVELDVEVNEFEIAEFEAILLCSDGLTGMVQDEQILKIFNQASNLQNAVRGLVSKAIENGGEDNVSVVMVKHIPS
ncbi:MAG: Stp1/IreP family PP2C-type Ser/Thr phosphatase [Holophagaceae bacterium]|nr:Stp1/IreP family PP2C-type Ser/Thr phosphatase [Holophagaceae bacterium]